MILLKVLLHNKYFSIAPHYHGNAKILCIAGLQRGPVTPDLTITLLFVFSWIKLRSAMLPHTILLEPISECMLSGALASLAAHILFKIDPVPFYMVHILVWCMFDWILIHVVQV